MVHNIEPDLGYPGKVTPKGNTKSMTIALKMSMERNVKTQGSKNKAFNQSATSIRK